jgi:hypothetical protein
VPLSPIIIPYSIIPKSSPNHPQSPLTPSLFSTYGIPTISKLLVQTRQLSTQTLAPKRYADTEVLITEFIANAPDSDRAIQATVRMNYIHSIYQKQNLISNDDMLYTLSLFLLEPIRWVRRYEWRSFTDFEICALGVFWKAQADAMNIDLSPLDAWHSNWSDNGLDFFHVMESWSDDYELRAMVPDANNKTTADETTAILLYDVPKFLRPTGRLVVSALMDPRLRAAMIYESPPPWLERLVSGGLSLRAMAIRWLFLPRPHFLRVRGIDDEPDKNGRLHLRYFAAEPWYVRSNVQNRWLSPLAWIKWARGLPIPHPDFKSEGYLIPEIGPRVANGKGIKEQKEGEERLRAMRKGAGCPFG